MTTSGLPHAVFLQRVADEPATSPDVRLGQGAFLALRFVDLLAPDREPPTADVFRYQWAATERYCAELTGEGTEAAHLSGIVRATGEAHRQGDIRLLAPALIAYALFLEQEASLQEAEDTLLTLLTVAGDRLGVADAIVVWMRLGRVRRIQTEFDQAAAAYREAGRLAQGLGDDEAVLLSRVGLCNVVHFRGDLPKAELEWRSLLFDAESRRMRSVQAQAAHGLGNVLVRRGQAHEGAPYLWRAFELYEEDMSRSRALGDLALALLALGDVGAAERALQQVIRLCQAGEVLLNALIELMHCASFRRDRLGFERWREQCARHLEEMTPNVRADYFLKIGMGLARFASYTKAAAHLDQALEISLAHGLHEMVFRIERIKNGLRDCAVLDTVEGAPAEPVRSNDALREVSASLAALGT